MAHFAVWDPFWFMREMFRWASASAAASFDVAEKEDAYVYKAKLTLPAQVDADHVKAALDNGELTLVLPKVAAVTPAPDVKLTLPDQVDANHVKAALDNGRAHARGAEGRCRASARSCGGENRRTKGSGRGSAPRKPRRGARGPSRRG